MKTKIKSIDIDGIVFENGCSLTSTHSRNCCEHHYLDFSYVIFDEVKDLEFDLSGDNFFKRIDDYGIELIPTNNFSVKIPGYGSNNGYYGSNIELVLQIPDAPNRTYDVSECQVITK